MNRENGLPHVVIVAPQFPPCNLTAVHRARLFAQHLPECGFRTTVLTVAPRFYEETLDWELERLVSPQVRVVRTPALATRPIRLVGDIGIRSFWYHYRFLRRLAKRERVDLLFLPIPPNYSCLLGPLLKRLCGIPYVIDYIDPWIYPITEQELGSWKARLSHWLARRLEPIAVGQADGITGVAAGYYEGVLERHPHLRSVPTAGIPFGCEPADHEYVEEARRRSGLLEALPRTGRLVFVYAGALLPRARQTLRGLFEACRRLRLARPDLASRLHLLFVGTGSPAAGTIAPVAAELHVSDLVTEVPQRQPYLDVLATLSQAHAVLVLGSTERHYTASKIFQAMYSRRPLLAMLHAESTAVAMLRGVPGVELVTFRDEPGIEDGVPAVTEALARLLELSPATRFRRDRACLEEFSARKMTERLADCFHEVLARAGQNEVGSDGRHTAHPVASATKPRRPRPAPWQAASTPSATTPMRTVVIVAPHFPPSGLPPAHRARQFARHLPEFGWQPIVLTVRPEFYQEQPDWNLMQLVPPDLEVIRTAAFPPKINGGLGIGDLGLRCVLQFRRALAHLCRRRAVDLLYLPCPPNYQLLLGRWSRANFGVPYVFDYIDPWNSDWLRRNARLPSKLWLSHVLSVCLEPYSIRHVSHVTSVSQGTNESVRRHYSWLGEGEFSVLPYGGEPELFEQLGRQARPSRCLEPRDGRFQLVYLGVMWEAAYRTLDAFLDALRLLRERQPDLYARVRVHFLGTTYHPNAKDVYQVLPRARSKGVGDAVVERPERVPFLEALRTMAQADGLLLLGSSEAHYTPSRLLPCLHARRPLFAVFHEASDATPLLRSSGSAAVVTYGTSRPVAACVEEIYDRLQAFLRGPGYDAGHVDWGRIDQFSAREMTHRLAASFDRVLAGPLARPAPATGRA